MQPIHTGHFLMGAEAGVWYRLLKENRYAVAREKIPQALLLTLTSTALAPAAALEKWIYGNRIRLSRPTRDPLFVVGHWRSGTTYLVNMLSRDSQFGWFDPVNTVIFPYSRLLGKVLAPAVRRGIARGRPMDNVQYDMDLPMEETFALLTQTDHDIIHMIAFPGKYEQYVSGAFVEDLPPEELRRWMGCYDYIIRKLTFVKGGRRLVLKSPDNTCRIPQLLELYPDARFLNIHRDPYRAIRSTVHMFSVQMRENALSHPPENVDELMEDVVVGIFERMYRQLFALEGQFRPHRYADIAFTDFTRDPVATLERVYDTLELPGFSAARPAFAAYAESQHNYQKNRLDLSPRLIGKINARLGFYLDRYGYETLEAKE